MMNTSHIFTESVWEDDARFAMQITQLASGLDVAPYGIAARTADPDLSIFQAMGKWIGKVAGAIESVAVWLLL